MAEEHAKRLLVEELMVLTGADALNLVQHRRQLESMSLDELGKIRAEIFADMDERYCIR